MSGKRRNGIAQAAHFRNSAGSMKDRRAPKGGASNKTRTYLDEFEEDEAGYVPGPEEIEAAELLIQHGDPEMVEVARYHRKDSPSCSGTSIDLAFAPGIGWFCTKCLWG